MENNNRYLIYKMLGRKVDVILPNRFGGQKIKGVVERVCRDIFGNAIEITIDGHRNTFREPEAIIAEGDSIMFMYGDVDPEPVKVGFEVPNYNGYDESLHEHLKRTARRPVSQTVFKLGALEKTPSCRWRTRVAVG